MQFNLDFPFAFGLPNSSAGFRTEVTDFIVEEDLGFSPQGNGEHIFLKIKKTGENTQYVAEKLAAHLGIRPMDVGFCGLKDRRAQTTQWFSLYQPGSDQDKQWSAFIANSGLQIEILEITRHTQKLRRGQHNKNEFIITLRHVSDLADVLKRLELVRQNGVPNFFGEQRFGWNAGNLILADDWFTLGKVIRNKNKKGLVLSAARAYLFNLVLARRIVEGSWFTLTAGDVNVNGIPTGPLWGRGRLAVSESALTTELETLAEFKHWCEKMEHCGLFQERRALVLKPMDLSWTTQGDQVTLTVALPPGEFATSLLRELTVLEKPAVENNS